MGILSELMDSPQYLIHVLSSHKEVLIPGDRFPVIDSVCFFTNYLDFATLDFLATTVAILYGVLGVLSIRNLLPSALTREGNQKEFDNQKRRM
jgi:hypothetical protein